MKKLLLLLLCFYTLPLTAQLSDGSVAPNWTLVDINGNSHTLYDYLDNGKTVFIDFSATWCSTCWNYHESHALEDLYQMYGPAGTDEVMVFFIEGEANSNTNCLYDIAGCNNSTQGDWTDGVSHPIIDDASINGLYEINGFPTIYGICSNRIITEVGRDDTDELYEFMVDDCYGEVNVSVDAITDESCFGEADGAIDLDIDGNPAPFSFLWSNGATTEDLENLAQGTYTCTITNSTGTTSVSDPIQISGPTSALVSNVGMVIAESCDGDDGSIMIMVNGGNPPYDFNWNTGSDSQNLSNVAEGIYAVTVSDDNNCEQILSNIQVGGSTFPVVTIAPATLLNCNLTQINLNGMASNAGTNTMYEWMTNGGTIISGGNSLTPTIDGPGMYTLMVTDMDTGCSSNASIMVSEVADIDISIASQTNVVCNGESNGFAMISVSGGNMPYNVSWSNETTGMMNNNLSGGTYMVTVTDGNNCTEIQNVMIMEPSTINISIMMQADVECNGESSGIANLLATGGTGSLEFLWPDGNTNSFRSDLSAGTYMVTVTDENECQNARMVVVEEPMILTTSISTTGETSLNSNDGTATVTPSGGTPPYSYLWNTGSMMATANNLGAGTYMVTVMDANSCVIIENAVINDFDCSAVAANLIGADILCNGGTTGTAMVEVNGGVGPYSYAWSNGSSTAMVSNLAADNYSVTVTDANNCPTIESIVISEPSILFLNISATGETSLNSNDGTATVTPSGGTSPYSYLWSTGSMMSTINNLGAGTYSVTVMDANNCVIMDNTIVNDFDCSIAANITSENVLCNGESTGMAIVEVNGGTGPYDYMWSNGSSNPMINNLDVGNYSVTVTDANDCPTIENVFVSEPSVLMLDISVTGETSLNSNDGTATVTPSGGTLPYSYLWSTGSMMATANNLGAGTYTVTVMDVNNCVTIDNAIVNDFDCSIVANITGENVLCNGGSTGMAMVEVNGGAGPYNYVWSNGSNTAMVNNLTAGNFSVTVTDANDCPTIENVMISEPPALSLNLSSTGETSFNASNGTATVTPNGGTPPYSYLWNNGASTAMVNNLSSGSYMVTVTDANDCPQIDMVMVNAFDCTISASIIGENISCNGAADGTAMVEVTGGNGPYNYQWSNGSSMEMISNLTPGMYLVTVTDINDCPVMKNVMITEPAIFSSAMSNVINNVCLEDNNGSATVSVTGGTSPYTYMWSNGMMMATAMNLTVGNYDVTINDANECQTMTSVEIIATTDLAVAATNLSMACFGEANGMATIDATSSGGITSYLWSNGQVGAIGTNLEAGDYGVTVTDNDGCTKTTIFSIGENPEMTLVVDMVSNDMNNNGTGAIDISVTGGTGLYTFTWMRNGMMISMDEDLSNLEAGTYSCIATDENGCTISSESIMVDNITGVNDAELASQIQLFPNPTSDHLHIRMSFNEAYEIQAVLFSVDGKKIMDSPNVFNAIHLIDWDLKAFPKGIYFTKIRIGESVITKKIVIQ